MTEQESLTQRIIYCVIRVHQTLGAGFLESIYRRALAIELRKQGLVAVADQEARVFYDEEEVGRHRLDLVIADQVVLELKAVEKLTLLHYAQLRSYLKATGLELGLLINFAGPRADFRRVELSARAVSPSSAQ